jgi:hypothetical protein
MSKELDAVLNAPIPAKPKGSSTAPKETPPDMEDIETFMGGKGPYAEKPKEPGLLDALADGARRLMSSAPAAPAEAPAAGPRRGGTRAESKPYVAGDKRIVNDELTRMGLDKPSLDPGDALDRRGSPVSEDQFNALKASMAAMPREQRGAVLGRKNLPKWMLPALVEANRQLIEEDNRFAQTGQMAAIPTFEARRGKLAEGGMEATAAGEQVRSDILLGQGTKVPGKATAEQPILDTATEQLAKAEGREWSKLGMAQRGIYDAGKGLVQAGAGLNAYVLRLAGDEQGAKRFERVASIQQAQRDAADEVDMMRRNAVDLGVIADTPAAYFDRMGVAFTSGLAQMLPSMAAGGLAGLGAGNAQKGMQIALTLMGTQTFGAEYVDPEAMEKLAPPMRAARALGMAGLEIVGERYGATPVVINAIMGRARKVPVEELPRWAEKAISGLEKRGLLGSFGGSVARYQAGEQIGEGITYTGQYLLDGSPMGLDKPMSVSEFISGAIDTAVVTAMTMGTIQAGRGLASGLANRRDRRPEEYAEPTADFSGGQQGATVPQFGGAPSGLPAGIPSAGAPPSPTQGGDRPLSPVDAPFDAGQLLGTPVDENDHTQPIQDGDLTTGDGMPYGSRAGAQARANKDGGEIAPVVGGWVVRPSARPGDAQGAETGDTRVDKPDVAVPAPSAPGAPVAGLDQPGGSGGTLGSGPAVPGGVVVDPAAPAPSDKPVGTVPPGNQPDDALSDDPDFKTSWPRPRGGPTSMFNGLEDDPKLLAEAVRGVHQETGFGIQARAAEARALLDGLASGTDPATGKPAKPERLRAMRGEVEAALDGIDGDLDAYADEFGEPASDKFMDVAAPDYFDMRNELARLGKAPSPAPALPPKPEPPAPPPSPTFTESEESWDGGAVVANIGMRPMPGADPDLIAALKKAGLIDAKGEATEKGWTLQRRISELSREGGPSRPIGGGNVQQLQQEAIDQALGKRKVRRELAPPSPAPTPAPTPAPSLQGRTADLVGPTRFQLGEDADLLADLLQRKLEKKGAISWEDIPADLANRIGTSESIGLKKALSEDPQGVVDALRAGQAAVPAPQANAEADFDDAMGDLGAIFGKNPAAGGGNAAAGDVSAAPAAAPTSSAPTGFERGAVGMKLASDQVVLTASGRKTTPFPKVKVDTDRKITATVKAVDRWLMENALAEAEARGDDFNATQFRANLNNPQQADKDAAEEYLFGRQPDVVPGILKPLASRPDPNVTKAGGKPNQHGHISDDTPGVEVFRSPERKDRAKTSFRVVEMADGSWLIGVEHNSTSGNMSGGVSGLNTTDHPARRFASRDDAVAGAIKQLRKTWEGLADPETPGGSQKQRSQAQAMLAWLNGVESGGDKPPAEKKVRKPAARGPATVNGSRMLARINSIRGISLDLLTELSVRQPTGKDDKRGRPVMRWFNPVGGDGALFREGGHNIDELARILEDDGYLEPGSIERDYKDAGERARDLIKGDLETPANAQKAQSLDQIEAEQQAEQQAELDAWNAMTPEEQADYMRARYGEPEPEPEFPDLSDEAAAEAQAEREAIIAESELLPADADSLLDADLDLDLEWARMIGAGLEDGMRSLGFNEQEIADAIRQADEDAAFYEAAEQSRESTESESSGEAVTDGTPEAGAVPAPGEVAPGSAGQEAARALEALADKVVNGRPRAADAARWECALLMPCGGMKLDRPAAARDFYTGPLWTTYRKTLGSQEAPQLFILSAKHGFVPPDRMMAPYDQLMTPERADELIANIARFGPPSGFMIGQPTDIQILGGEQYRRVMRAAVAKAIQDGEVPATASVREFVGGTGEMNRAVKQYVEGLPPSDAAPAAAPEAPAEPRLPGGGYPADTVRERMQVLQRRSHNEALERLKPQTPPSYGGLVNSWLKASAEARKLLAQYEAEALAKRKGQMDKLQRQLKAALKADPIEAQHQREEARIDEADRLVVSLNEDQVVALAKALGMKTSKRRVEELRTLLLMRKADEVLAEAAHLFKGMGSLDMDDESAEWERRFEQLFVEPAKTERAADTAGPTISQADADAKLKEWQAAAQNPKDRGKNSGITVLSLFDHTGIWSGPWVEAGYNVIQVDIKNGDDINDISIESLNDAGIDDVDVILAAVPCTDFAASGARWWADKDKDGRLEASLDLLNQTKAILEYFRPRVWAIENPVGRIQSVGGLPSPRLIFDPHHYGDPYTKKTLLFGNFNPNLPSANVEPTEGSKIVKLSSSAKAEREATPEGFAYAFFMANGEDFGPVGQAPAESLLGSYDEAELRARAEAEAAALEVEREQQRKLAAQAAARTRAANADELRRRQEQIRRERADAAVDGFELGQEPPSSTVTPSQAVGQMDVFGDAPVSEVRPSRDETVVSLRKRISVLESLRDCLRR